MSLKNNPLYISGDGSLLQQRIVNPPSIPSHMNIFGYDENEMGQLIKQQSNQIGFTGSGKDKVGPGDYDVEIGLVSKNVTGIVSWRKPPL